MAQIDVVDRAVNGVRQCRAMQGFLDRYLVANTQGACIMDVRLYADSPEWVAIKNILQAKISRELEAAEQAFQKACTDTSSSRSL